MLACGLSRPHAPHLAPKEFVDLYPLDKVRMPKAPEGDLNDVPKVAKVNWSTGFTRKLRSEPEEWRRAVQGYLASTSFADAAVGRILDALAASGRDKDTIVVILGDHGFQVGQKNRWEKFTLWDLGGRTTMIMAVPGISGRTVKPAVSFLDIFPTIAAMVSGTRPDFVEGNDLTPLIRNPQMAWDKPAVQSYQQGNVGVRLGPWNYIRYKDGSEELYNLESDPLELKNLVAKGRGKHGALIESLQIHMPKVTNPQVDYKPLG
jgi:arylsulfatase A-like enzyme